MLVNSRCFPDEVIFNRHLADVIWGADTTSQSFVWSKHFTDDCILNLGQYRAGLYERLKINRSGLPTLTHPILTLFCHNPDFSR